MGHRMAFEACLTIRQSCCALACLYPLASWAFRKSGINYIVKLHISPHASLRRTVVTSLMYSRSKCDHFHTHTDVHVVVSHGRARKRSKHCEYHNVLSVQARTHLDTYCSFAHSPRQRGTIDRANDYEFAGLR